MNADDFLMPRRSGLDVVLSSLKGHIDAERLIDAVSDGHAHPDTLFTELQALEATGDDARLKGWARTIQKELERRA